MDFLRKKSDLVYKEKINTTGDVVSGMVETDWDKVFREKLKSIWKELNGLIESKLDKELIENRLKSIADDFLNTFQVDDCPIPVEYNELIYNKFHSISIPLKSFSLFIPHFLYTLNNLKPKPDLNAIFIMPVTWYTFLSYFYETVQNIRKPLTESDIRILSVMTRYRPKSTDTIIPFSNSEISKLVGTIGKRKKTISENTVNKRVAYLYSENILHDRLLINPWAIGYVLRALIYNKEYDSEMDTWDDYTNYKQFFMSNKLLRIVRLPQHAEGEFTIPNFVTSFEITEYWSSNNISQLNSKDIDSFIVPPNFEVLKTSDYVYTKFNKEDDVKWIDKLLAMTYSMKKRSEERFASLNKISENKRLEKSFQFFSFVAKEQRIRIPISQTAKRANLDEIHFLDFLRFFIDQKIINFTTHTAFIGCNYRIGVMITSLKKPVKEHPKLQLFLQNLLELPLIISFIGTYIICTYIRIPLKWVGVFTTYLNMLMTKSDLQIEFGTHMALQSYVHWNTPFSEDTILTTYGVLYNPQFKSESIETK